VGERVGIMLNGHSVPFVWLFASGRGYGDQLEAELFEAIISYALKVIHTPKDLEVARHLGMRTSMLSVCNEHILESALRENGGVMEAEVEVSDTGVDDTTDQAFLAVSFV
jgi:hypothetical protein